MTGAVAVAQIPAHAPTYPGPPGIPALGGGLPPVAPIPPFGTYNPAASSFRGQRHLPRAGGRYAYTYPMFTGYGPPSPPSVIIVNNVPPEAENRPARPPEPEPAKPILREYDWSAYKEGAGLPAPPSTWTIALKDGTFAEATMLWVQDGRLFFIDVDGGQSSVAMESVDRRKTSEANRLRGVLRF